MNRDPALAMAADLVGQGFDVQVYGRAAGGSVLENWPERWTLAVTFRDPITVDRVQEMLSVLHEGYEARLSPTGSGLWVQSVGGAL